MSKSYSWWCGRKKRIKKKYTLLLGSYFSPKELKVFYRRYKLEINKKKSIKRRRTGCGQRIRTEKG